MSQFGSGTGEVEDSESTGGSTFILQVPSETDSPGGYIRMGAVPTHDGNVVAEPGDDLVAKVQAHVPFFVDDTRDRGTPFDADATPAPAVQTGADPDDWAFNEKSKRKAESDAIVSRGGVRDHSEGNRISTTGGDKIEVIRGNYQLVVLGRQGDLADGVTFDASGGLLQTSTRLAGASTKIEWTQNYDGTWKVTEDTIKGDLITTFHSDVEDVYYGNKQISITGAESFTAQQTVKDGYQNPVITEKTWAQSIKSYTGKGAPVPSIVEQTWAKKISSVTAAKSIVEITSVTKGGASVTSVPAQAAVDGQITSYTMADSVQEDVVVSGDITEEIDCDGTLKVTGKIEVSHEDTHGTIANLATGTAHEWWFGNFSEFFHGTSESFRVAGFTVEFSLVAVAVEAFVGKSFELFGGQAFELHLGNKLDLVLGKSWKLEEESDWTAYAGWRKALCVLIG